MSVSISLFEGAGRFNWVMVGFMSISPLIVLRYLEFTIKDILIMLYIVTIILCTLMNNPQSMRWSTILFSCLFISNFMAYSRLLRYSNFSIADFENLIKFLIYAYTIVLLIQQYCVLTGLPIFNVMSGYNPAEPWKLNSLSGEPSWTARRMGLMMYCYITIKEMTKKTKYDIKSDFRSDQTIWFAFLWTMTTMISGTAFLFLFLILLKIIRLKTLLPALIISIGVILFAKTLEIKSLDRAYNVTLATLTLNEEEILKTDDSAAFRIVPCVVGAKLVGFTTVDDWFGHGIDYTNKITSKYIKNAPKSMGGAGPFTIWIEYGFLAFIIINIFTFSTCIRKDDLFSTIIFWIFLVAINGINIQITWGSLIFFHTIKHFDLQSKNKETPNI